MKAKYSRLNDNFPGTFFYRYNRNGFIYISSSITGILGYTPDEFLTLLSDHHIDIRNKEFMGKTPLSMSSTKHSPYDVQVPHKNGSVRWFSISEAPITLNRKNEVVMVEGIAHEITRLKTAEENLKESEFRYRQLVDKSPDAIGMVDMNGKYITCNSTYANMLGYSIEELKDLDFISLTPKKWHNWEMEEIVGNQIIARGYSDVYEKEYIKKDGTVFPVELRSHLMKNKKGKPIALWGYVRDITERKRSEENIRQTQKMEAIGTLAGGIAHDFNNILAAIIGYAELAQDEISQNNTLKEYIKQILTSSLRAKDLVKQILTFSRKGHEERSTILFSSVLKETIKLLRSTIPTTIEIRQNIVEQSGVVNADPTQLHQVIMNLCINAAHAMEKSEGIIDISLSPFTISENSQNEYPNLPPGPYIKLEISDTGSGIDNKIIHRIFEPFFTTKEKEKGTGMGLAVVYGIVKDYGGNIIVDSQLGKGTTFTILLPQATTKPINYGVSPAAIPGGNEHILFVDDEKLLLDIGKQILESLGYTVTPKNSSVEALDSFLKKSDAYDMVITDQTMSQMTGYDLAKRIFKINPSIPIILCTGHSDTITSKAVETAGFKSLIYKPFRKQDIAQKVREVFDNKGS